MPTTRFAEAGEPNDLKTMCGRGWQASTMELPRLAPGATLDRVVDALTAMAREAGNGNSWGSGHGIQEQIDHYVKWAETAEGQLGNVLTVDSTTDLVRTAGYWALRTTPSDAVRLNTLIRSEYTSRQTVLTELAHRFSSEAKRWTENIGVLVIPDTNMFLDKDEPLDQIDWPTLADTTIDVRLVVPLVVIHELDRLKRQGNSTTAQAARAAIRWLAQALPPAVGGRSVPFPSGARVATVEAYIHGGPTRVDDADGVIIELVRWLSVVSGLPTTLVTKDLGMSLRAAAASIKVVYLEKDPDASSVARRA